MILITQLLSYSSLSLIMDFIISHIFSPTSLIVLASLIAITHSSYHQIRQGIIQGKPPPQPSISLPIIGHLHLFREETPLARILSGLADKVGPIFSIQVGAERSIVVSSYEGVKSCFTQNDRAFASRARTNTAEYLGYNYAVIALTPYGPYWREVRKMAMVKLLSTRKLESLTHVRISEVQDSIKELYSVIQKNTNGVAIPTKVVLSRWFEQLALNLIVKTLTGKRYENYLEEENDGEGKSVRRLFKEVTGALTTFQMIDLVPFEMFRKIDFTGSIKNMKRISNELDVIMQNWIDEHAHRRKNNKGYENQDFIDEMLSAIEDDQIIYGYTRDNVIKSTLSAIIFASTDTSTILQTWLMSLLLNNKDVMTRAKEEIDTKVGKDRWVKESDIDNLTYLQAVVKETLRLYPPAPLLVQRQSVEDCNLEGYFVRKGTNLFVNAWKLHRDPNFWKDPNEFQPDRFLTTHADFNVYGHQYHYLPFSAGRRSCPGARYAMLTAHLTLARMLQGFNFETPSNLPVDMKEGVGLLLIKADPLEVMITPRLAPHFYDNVV